MNVPQVLIVSGMPGVGKTHVATRLARRYALPVVAKDAIKESLFDTLGTGSARWSRQLSNASFAAMFVVASEILVARGSLLLEGNFRVKEHESAMRALLAKRECALVQILCRLPEPRRRERLERRAARAERHPGHLDSLFLRRESTRADRADEFLDLPGAQIVHDTTADDAEPWNRLVQQLDAMLPPQEISP
jgi:predicted kinase